MALLLAVAFVLHGCFKETVDYTRFHLAIYEQVDGEGAYFAVDTTNWYIASWEDAVAHRITNKTTGEVMDEPAEVGEFNSSDEYQATILVNSPISMLVVVNPELKLYAYRKYETPINLPEVFTQLHLYAWRKSGNVNGWTMVNPFPDEPRESLTGG